MMKLEPTTVKQLTITGAPGRLDPIRVITEDISPGAGRITITCYGRAWVAYWGAMGGTLHQFVPHMSAEYILGYLTNQSPVLMPQYRANDRAYTLRIIEAVQEALRLQLRAELHGSAA